MALVARAAANRQNSDNKADLGAQMGAGKQARRSVFDRHLPPDDFCAVTHRGED